MFQTQYAKNAVLTTYVVRLLAMLHSTQCLELMPFQFHVRLMDYKHRSIFPIVEVVILNASECDIRIIRYVICLYSMFHFYCESTYIFWLNLQLYKILFLNNRIQLLNKILYGIINFFLLWELLLNIII